MDFYGTLIKPKPGGENHKEEKEDAMQAIINFFTGTLNTVAWLYIFLPCTILGGLYLTIRNRGIQFTKFGELNTAVADGQIQTSQDRTWQKDIEPSDRVQRPGKKVDNCLHSILLLLFVIFSSRFWFYECSIKIQNFYSL